MYIEETAFEGSKELERHFYSTSNFLTFILNLYKYIYIYIYMNIYIDIFNNVLIYMT